ncbi:MAG: hypothetical protein IPL53_23360 [Ignavibacteria bacterium]|nr:hypothetical protein [Ignavibacteria bacterium]
MVCVYIIYKASSGFRGMTGKILELPFLIYLGKISYGLYLYHNFIPMICKVLGLPAFGNIYINFMVQLSLLILISSLSWFLIEKPINGLKKYFSYN